ncbi:hypothetical protein AB33_4552 [Escherichia coli 2-427-07_S1_C2]|nr:hypothetical protein AC06_4546 [Escherichia coli 3-373-03_S3_C1]KDT80259.1 hypothetical protein AC90_4756 [Escherichia coli 3-475-03_S4_C1]KDY19470.1 hypothetical protein AB33_4552 [Escherichia coli 2-427-07_S1_C2]
MYGAVRRNDFIIVAKPNFSGFFRTSICGVSYTFGSSSPRFRLDKKP